MPACFKSSTAKLFIFLFLDIFQHKCSLRVDALLIIKHRPIVSVDFFPRICHPITNVRPNLLSLPQHFIALFNSPVKYEFLR